MAVRLKREDIHFVLEDGIALRVDVKGGDLSPLGKSFSQFIQLIPEEDQFRVEKFRSDSIRLAAEQVGSGAILGTPVGRNGRGVVFRVVKVK